MDRYYYCRRCDVHIVRFDDEEGNRCSQCHCKMQLLSEEEFEAAMESDDD